AYRPAPGPGGQLDPPRRRRGRAPRRLPARRRRPARPAFAPVRAQRAGAGDQPQPDHYRARRLDPRPEARPARLGLWPERWPGPRPGHRPGLPGHPQRPLPGCAGADLPEPGRPFLSPSEGHAMSSLPAPLNLQAWIEQHRHLLKPPVGNKCIHDGDFIVMVVGGPNARTDFHLDEGPEWFYQLEGEMVLRV